MGPKKKAADDGEDLSIDQFWKVYKKNCAAIDMPISKSVKERYESDYLENNEPVTKVSLSLFLKKTSNFIFSLIFNQFNLWE